MSDDFLTNILIVEDSPLDLVLIRDVIKSAFKDTVSVSTATSVDEARGCFLRAPVDVVVLDLTLSDASDMDAVKALRTISPSTPIVICTGDNTEESKLRAIVVGAFYYVSKSDIHDLPRAIVAAIDERRMRVYCYRRIHDRLGRILQVVEETSSVLLSTKKEVDRNSSVIFGTGDKEGLVASAEAMRQLRAQLRWAVITLVGAILVAFGTAIVNFMWKT